MKLTLNQAVVALSTICDYSPIYSAAIVWHVTVAIRLHRSRQTMHFVNMFMSCV